jgi:hypothetical protein
MYFSQKIMDQDHKLSSMAGVVTSMADELQFLRSKIQQGIPPASLVESNQPLVSQSDIKLIPVSDDEDESDSEDEEDSDDEAESDEEDSDDEEDREPLEIMSELINISEVPSIKVINMTEGTFYNESIENEVEELVMDEDDDNISESEEDDGADEDDGAEEHNTEVEVDESTMDLMNSSMLKSIHILSSEDDAKIDYKKLSLAKLKELVLEKDLAKDPSRMKKPELLKLLEQ